MVLTNAEETVATLVERAPLHEPLARRRSPKGFLERKIGKNELRSLFEAARWSPSSRNEQPWRFVVASQENADDFARLLETLTPKNQEWAKQASVLIAVITKTAFERDGATNRHAGYDAGGAVANLTVQAVSLGLQVHQMAGFDATTLRENFAVPPGYDPMTVLAVGFADEAGLLQKQRTRRELEDLVYEGNWSNAMQIVETSRKEN